MFQKKAIYLQIIKVARLSLAPRLNIKGTLPSCALTPSENWCLDTGTTLRFIISNFDIALGYRLDDRGSRVRFLAGAGNFSLHHRVQNGSEAHSASYSMGTRGSFPGGKAAGA
jgi:hypothetical protein